MKTLDAETVAVLHDQTRRLVRFADDVAALAQAEEAAARPHHRGSIPGPLPPP